MVPEFKLSRHQNSAAEIKMITRHDYRIGDYTLSWDWDPDEHDARNFKNNNLYIDGIWNMSDTSGMKRADTCVSVIIIDDRSFQFTTFLGLKYEMTISNGSVEVVSRKCVF